MDEIFGAGAGTWQYDHLIEKSEEILRDARKFRDRMTNDNVRRRMEEVLVQLETNIARYRNARSKTQSSPRGDVPHLL